MTVTIKDLSRNEELDREAMAAAQGGMSKLPFQLVSLGNLLTIPGGDPVQVYDTGGALFNSPPQVYDTGGALFNSASTGYAPK
jgi:hypothetical protein